MKRKSIQTQIFQDDVDAKNRRLAEENKELTEKLQKSE